MNTPNLQARPAIARATLQIKRKATGVVETHEVVFYAAEDQPEAEPQQEQPKEAE